MGSQQGSPTAHPAQKQYSRRPASNRQSPWGDMLYLLRGAQYPPFGRELLVPYVPKIVVNTPPIHRFYWRDFVRNIRRMACEQCEHLWKLYAQRRTMQVKLLLGAKWGRQHLGEALERAERERQLLRQ